MYAVKDAPDPDGYDMLALGFWAHRAGPDPAMLRYMERVKGKSVALFGTMAAYPGSEHARQVEGNARAALAGNRVLGTFLCQGRLAPERLARHLDPARRDPKHPLTPERRARLLEAEKHPDEADFVAARAAFTAFLGTLSV